MFPFMLYSLNQILPVKNMAAKGAGLIERYSHQGRGMMKHIIMVSTVCQDKY